MVVVAKSKKYCFLCEDSQMSKSPSFMITLYYSNAQCPRFCYYAFLTVQKRSNDRISLLQHVCVFGDHEGEARARTYEASFGTYQVIANASRSVKNDDSTQRPRSMHAIRRSYSTTSSQTTLSESDHTQDTEEIIVCTILTLTSKIGLAQNLLYSWLHHAYTHHHHLSHIVMFNQLRSQEILL
jgi:hypothetical protein